jgi:hypothetical protein
MDFSSQLNEVVGKLMAQRNEMFDRLCVLALMAGHDLDSMYRESRDGTRTDVLVVTVGGRSYDFGTVTIEIDGTIIRTVMTLCEVPSLT